ncbi:hypothetical protein ABZ656_37775 [Streptomyces sp. NPDC007095]|uniref:hypothetical protein n=1 Tax=Streptomyces sp. NPDC007095 TaxID=3154482 RepID=UPI0033D15F60
MRSVRGDVRRPGGDAVTRDDDTFPAALDAWTPADWRDYRERVDDGEGSAAAIDAINRRRRRRTRDTTGTEVSQ